MAELTSEKFAQRAFDLNLLDERQLDAVWADFGTRNVPLKEFHTQLVRRELLTNFQVEKILRGDRSGYFYGKYKMLYLVGTGTFARVFRAVDSESDDVVACKVLRKRFGDDPDKTEQFDREGQMGMSLRHPSIVPIYETHSDRRSHFLVMEFVEGHNLRHFVRVRGKLDSLIAAKLIIDVCSGLTYAFDRGITHRDLKLSNVLVSSSGRAKLVDFGLAAANGQMSDEALAAFPNPRTIDYAALERATGVRKDDPRSDIYFVGCILYHMLTGQAPLRETKDRIQRLSIQRFEEVLPISTLEPGLPVPIVMVVNKAMELNPKRRYQSPIELLSDLQLVVRRIEQAAESGESLAWNEADDTAKTGTLAPDPAAPKFEGTGKTLMVVESNVGMQDILREQLKKHGYRVLVFSDPLRALERFAHEEAAHCVIFSTNELGASALKAFNDFACRDRTKRTPAILLLGEKQADWQSQAQLGDRRAVIHMPVRMKQFRGVIRQLLASAN